MIISMGHWEYAGMVDRLVSKTNDLGRESSSLSTPTKKVFVAQTVTLGAVCYTQQQKSVAFTRKRNSAIFKKVYFLQ